MVSNHFALFSFSVQFFAILLYSMMYKVRSEARNRLQAAQTQPVYCGIVVALRENFGFLSPLACFSQSDVECAPVMSAGAEGTSTPQRDPTESFLIASNTSKDAVLPLQQALSALDLQHYFSDREAYSDVQVGDHVSYFLRETAKGSQALQLRKINIRSLLSTFHSIPETAARAAINIMQKSEEAHKRMHSLSTDVRDEQGRATLGLLSLRGVIVKDCDVYRGLPGAIRVTHCQEVALLDSKIQQSTEVQDNHGTTASQLPAQLLQIGLVSFTSADISKFSRNSATALEGSHGKPGAHALPVSRGDEVLFHLHYNSLSTTSNGLAGSSDHARGGLYVRAALVTLSRSSKELKQKLQLIELKEQNQPRMQGVIKTARPNGPDGHGYGFIEPVDQKALVYFKYEDVKAADNVPGATPNMNPEEAKALASLQLKNTIGPEVINGVPLDSPEPILPNHLTGRIFEGLEIEFYLISEPMSGVASGGITGRNRSQEPRERAIGITTLPRGTVHFEASIVKNVNATVIIEPRAHPQEEPGIVRLHQSVTYTPTSLGLKTSLPKMALTDTIEVNDIELWGRCASDGMTFKMGDVVTLDVNYYRPEQLLFARNLRIAAYNPLGRRVGKVVSVRYTEDSESSHTGFGFLALQSIAIDDGGGMQDHCYFRLSEAVACNGSMLPTLQVAVGMLLTCDVVRDDVKGGSMRYRAVRLRQLDSSTSSNEASRNIENNAVNSGGDPTNNEMRDVVLIAKSLKGRVVKDCLRKNVPGTIEVIEGTHSGSRTNEPNTVSAVCFQERWAYSQLKAALAQYATAKAAAAQVAMSSGSLNIGPLRIEALSMAEVRMFYSLLSDVRITEPLLQTDACVDSSLTVGQAANAILVIDNHVETSWVSLYGMTCDLWPTSSTSSSDQAYSALSLMANQATGLHALVLNVLPAQPTSAAVAHYHEWCNATRKALADTAEVFSNVFKKQQQLGLPHDESGSRRGQHSRERDTLQNAGNMVLFHKNDTIDTFGQIANDLTVTFDLYIDRGSNQRIAREVTLTDEPADDLSVAQQVLGVLEVVASRGHFKYGYLRCIETDEKLFWSTAGCSSSSDHLLIEHAPVLYSVRRRGGLRTAVDLAAVVNSAENTAHIASSPTDKNKTKNKNKVSITKPNLSAEEREKILATAQAIQQPGQALAIVVENQFSINTRTVINGTTDNDTKTMALSVVLIDTCTVESIAGRLWDVCAAVSFLPPHLRVRSALSSTQRSWERRDLQKDLTANHVENKAMRDEGGASQVDVGTSDAGNVEANSNTRMNLSDTTTYRYFPPGPRTTLGVLDAPVATSASFTPGQIVLCNVHTHFLKTSGPVHVSHLQPLSGEFNAMHTLSVGRGRSDVTATVSLPTTGLLSLRRGAIQRTGLRPRLTPEESLTGTERSTESRDMSNNIYEGLSFCEIKELPTNADPAKLNVARRADSGTSDQASLFYCDIRDVVLPATNGAAIGASVTADGTSSLSIGDEVLFYGVTIMASAAVPASDAGSQVSVPVGLALYPQLCPRKVEKEGIVFKRSVNQDLKAAAAAVGGVDTGAAGLGLPPAPRPQGIRMARGPEDSGQTSGFPTGWRDTHLLTLPDTLPWAQLLPYNLPYVPLVAADGASTGVVPAETAPPIKASSNKNKAKRNAAVTVPAAQAIPTISLSELEKALQGQS